MSIVTEKFYLQDMFTLTTTVAYTESSPPTGPKVTVTITCNKGSFCSSPPQTNSFLLENDGTPTTVDLCGQTEDCQIKGSLNIVFLNGVGKNRGINADLSYGEYYGYHFEGVFAEYSTLGS